MEYTIDYNEQMLNRYPEVIKAIREFQLLIKTQSMEVEEMHKHLTNILSNAYITSADEETIAMWEQYLGITPLDQGDDTLEAWLEDRKETILARLYQVERLNSATIADIVKIFTGGTVTSFFRDGTIHVYIDPPNDSKQYKFENVEQELRKKVPAHLNFVVSRNYYTWLQTKNDYSTWNDVYNGVSTWEELLFKQATAYGLR